MSPSQTRREKVEERETAILKAAREVFVEHGFEGARMAEIGRRAGIAEGTVYLYFKTKTALMEALLANHWNGLTAGAWTAIEQHDAPLDKLRALAEFHVQEVSNDAAFVNLTARLRDFARDDPVTRAQIKAYVAVFDDAFQSGIKTGLFMLDVPLWMARDLYYGTLDYSIRTMILHGGGPADTVIENLIQALVGLYGTSRSRRAEAKGDSDSSVGNLIVRLETAVLKLEDRVSSREGR